MAFDSVWKLDDQPNTIVRTTGLGFQRAVDAAVFEAFVPQYFDQLESMWATRTYAIADDLIEGFWPVSLANEQLAQAAREWLNAHDDAPAPLRRLISENLDGTVRALAAQKRDAGK